MLTRRSPDANGCGRWPIAILVAASLAVGGSDDGAGNPDSELTPEQATAPLEGAPPELAAIREQANELLPGGLEAFEQRLEELRGTPVVVNKWASWCGPCRFEFPFFQAEAEARGDKIAFLGVDSDDSDDAALTFLEELPLPYPSYSDPEKEIAKSLDADFFPSTAFIDARGEVAHVKIGPYESEDALAADIDRYAR